MQESLWSKVGSVPLRFSSFHILLFLVMEAIWTDLFLCNFETTLYKNHFDVNLVKIHSAVIEILSISCFVLFLVTLDGGHIGMPNCEMSKWLHTRVFVTQSWYNSI